MTFFYTYKKIKLHWIIVSGIFIFSCSHPICEDIDTLPPGEEIGGIIRDTIILKPGIEGKDAIISYRYPDSNYVNSKSLNVVSWKYIRTIDFENSFFDFDIENSIPNNAKIKKAILKLYADTTNQFKGLTGHVYQDLRFWKLNLITNSWNEDSITWNNQPQIEDSTFVEILSPTYSSQAFEIDVKKFVQKKLSKSPEVYGFKLDFSRGNNSSTATIALRFCSSDHQNSELWPELQIEYEIEQ